jgi:CDP-glucose 4,6-dehydratase
MSAFWRGRRVLVTGHTGFKGAWLALWLHEMGAEVAGLALPPEGFPNLHDLLDLPSIGHFVQADINDGDALRALLTRTQPEFVFHLAAQAIVRTSYADPVQTYRSNVLGTVSLLHELRALPSLKGAIVVTSDKTYENREWVWGYRETDHLGGHDPYSASKAATEIAAISMRRCFFAPLGAHPARIATVRAGNVIGGGDWAVDRLVPDIIRGCMGEAGVVRLRNPNATRPWQHVLEPLAAYLLLAERLCTDPDGHWDEAWNIGPYAGDVRAVRDVAEALISALGRGTLMVEPDNGGLHEARLLALDCAKANSRLGWRPRLSFSESLSLTAEWYGAWARGENVRAVTREQLKRYGSP